MRNRLVRCELVPADLADSTRSWYLNQILPTPSPPTYFSSHAAQANSSTSKSRKSSSPRKPKAIKVSPGLQPLTFSFPPSDSSATGERELIYFYCVPSTSARVVAYQVRPLPDLLAASIADERTDRRQDCDLEGP